MCLNVSISREKFTYCGKLLFYLINYHNGHLHFRDWNYMVLSIYVIYEELFTQRDTIYLFYLTLHRLFPLGSRLCWRCQKEIATPCLSCRVILDFWTWTQVRQWIFKLMDVQLLVEIAAFLLHLTLMSLKCYERSLLHLLTVAKVTMPLYWKQTTLPPISLWFAKINKIYQMETRLATANQKEECCCKTVLPSC